MHITEWVIIIAIWAITFASLWFIPRNKIREASFIFLFTQLPTWIFGLLVVEWGLIEYPVREFSRVNATSFSFEFFVMPVMTIFLILYYPERKPLLFRLSSFGFWLSLFVLVEYLVEKYTLTIRYLHWHWYFTFISMSLVIYFVRVVYKWFFKLPRPFAL